MDTEHKPMSVERTSDKDRANKYSTEIFRCLGMEQEDYKKSCYEGSKLDEMELVDWIMVSKRTNQKYILCVRVQYDTTWNTFTIRASRSTGTMTELDKLRKGPIIPNVKYIHIQAYVVNGVVESAAVVESKKLVNYIDTEKPRLLTSYNASGTSADFYVIPWDKLSDIVIYTRKVAGVTQLKSNNGRTFLPPKTSQD